MKILLVNKFNFLGGGADKYFLDLAGVLESKGHEVIKFCMQHPKNMPDKNEKYFVSYVDIGQKGTINKLRYAGRILYSFEAKKKFDELLNKEKPDLIHIHNIYHQISPSILSVAKKHKIPVVMHLHDYKLVSPNYSLFSHGKIDTASVGGHYMQTFFKKSFNNSYLQSLLVAKEMYLHHTFLKIYKRNINYYIAPSEFMRDFVTKAGVSAERVIHIPYFVKNIENDIPNYEPGKEFLYYGRLSEEKGIEVLLQSLALVPSAYLKIIGEGKQRAALEKLTAELGLTERVKFIGALYNDDLKKEISSSLAVIVPSVWSEVFGLVNVEAAALGKLVIASDIGGIKETVRPDISAWLFKAGDVNALAVYLQKALSETEEVSKAGQAGREFVVQHFTSDIHWSLLKTVYEKALVN
jgi:glycosyltransferase involved in cell wall biosynthesis